MIQNSQLDGDLSTWTKAKDILLMGAAGLAVTLVLVILVKVTNIEIQMATYQAENRALDHRLQKVEGAVEEHLKEDREKFRIAGVR